jgi:hypothetical protein
MADDESFDCYFDTFCDSGGKIKSCILPGFTSSGLCAFLNQAKRRCEQNSTSNESIESDPNGKSDPNGTITQDANDPTKPNHFTIAPKDDMLLEHFQMLLNELATKLQKLH